MSVPRQDRLVVIPEDYAISYCPNADFERIWRPILGNLTYVAVGGVILIALLAYCGVLEPMILFFAHGLLVPLKPLLQAPPNHAAENVIHFIGQFSLWVYGLMGLWVAMIALRRAEQPTHIGLTKTGLLLTQYPSTHKQHWIVQSIPWDQIKSITVVRPQGTKSKSDYRINIVGKSYGLSISIKYGDILIPAQRDMFLHALKSAVPEGVFEEPAEEVFAVFKAAKSSEGFTELWLNELSAPSKRENLTPLTPGMVLQDGAYVVTRKLGTGGQGTVYLATKHDRITGAVETVALKEFVMPVFPDARVRKTVAEKFQQEAQMLSRINHPQIVKLFDVFVEDHRAYLVLERITGKTLKRAVQDGGPMSEEQVLGYAAQMVEILQYLHTQDPPVIHRDFTPDNLMLSDDGKIFLIDFSVAQQVEINITGSVVGKHLYMAPEQFRGKASTASDLYSLGATLSYLLTGIEPEAISVAHPKSMNADVSEALDRVVSGCTTIDESKRMKLDDIQSNLQSCMTETNSDGAVLQLKKTVRDVV
ncbi:MAG TPA: serine/threonine-protein kinase [Drouetiella sp.]